MISLKARLTRVTINQVLNFMNLLKSPRTELGFLYYEQDEKRIIRDCMKAEMEIYKRRALGYLYGDEVE